MANDIAIAPLTGQHLTEREYRAEEIMRLQRLAIEQGMAIRRAQLHYKAQQRQASLLGLAISLKTQAEAMRACCEYVRSNQMAQSTPLSAAGRMTKWLVNARRWVSAPFMR